MPLSFLCVICFDFPVATQEPGGRILFSVSFPSFSYSLASLLENVSLSFRGETLGIVSDAWHHAPGEGEGTLFDTRLKPGSERLRGCPEWLSLSSLPSGQALWPGLELCGTLTTTTTLRALTPTHLSPTCHQRDVLEKEDSPTQGTPPELHCPKSRIHLILLPSNSLLQVLFGNNKIGFQKVLPDIYLASVMMQLKSQAASPLDHSVL